MRVRYNNAVKFSDVKIGDVIKHDDHIYMKMEHIETDDSCRYNVIDLTNGQLRYLDDLNVVTPLNCDLLVY